MDVIDKIYEMSYIKELATKQRAAKRYSLRIVPREKEGDLVFKQLLALTQIEKLIFN